MPTQEQIDAAKAIAADLIVGPTEGTQCLPEPDEEPPIGVEYADGNIVKVYRLPRFRKFFDRCAKERKRVGCCYGGGGSGKSYSIMQEICAQAINYMDTGIDVLIARESRTVMRDAPWPQVQKILDSWKVDYDVRETSLDITIGESQIHFRGMDDSEKIKSTNYHWAWIEEATAVSYSDYLQCKLRLRAPCPSGLSHRIWLSFNPIDANHWCVKKIIEMERTDQTIAVMHSTYKDNPFLPKEYVQILLDFINQDMNHYRIYTLGEPGRLEHIIYSNWNVLDMIQAPLRIKENPYIADAYGIDWGYNNEMAMVAYWIHDDEDYIQEKLYRKGMTTEDLAAWMESNNIPQGVEIFADPSNPEAIESLSRHGWNIVPLPPNCRSVKMGIDYCKGRKLHVITGSENLIKELRGYSYKSKKDRQNQGETIVIDEPVKFNDHLMDAMRYARYALKAYSGQSINPEGSSIEQELEESVCRKRERDIMYL